MFSDLSIFHFLGSLNSTIFAGAKATLAMVIASVMIAMLLSSRHYLTHFAMLFRTILYSWFVGIPVFWIALCLLSCATIALLGINSAKLFESNLRYLALVALSTVIASVVTYLCTDQWLKTGSIWRNGLSLGPIPIRSFFTLRQLLPYTFLFVFPVCYWLLQLFDQATSWPALYSIHPVLSIVRSDLKQLRLCLFITWIWMFVPALIMSAVAFPKTYRASWPEYFRLLGFTWLSGTIAWTAAIGMLSGIAILAFREFGSDFPRNFRDHTGKRHFFHADLQILTVMAVSFLIACTLTYRWISHRLAAQAALPAEGRGSSSSAIKLSFHFTLRTFLLAQVVLTVPFGLWMMVRRASITSHYESRAMLAEYEAWKASVNQRFVPHGWKPIAGLQPRTLSLYAGNGLTNVNDSTLELIEPTDQLVRLDLKSNAITDAGLEWISQFSTIEVLNLQSDQITDKGLAELLKLPRLRHLTITCPQLSDKALANLASIESLKEISIYEPYVLEETKADLPLLSGYIRTRIPGGPRTQKEFQAWIQRLNDQKTEQQTSDH